MKKTIIFFTASVLILVPLAAASLTLLSPNGGERWILGETKAITWKAENWTGHVNISIRKPSNCSYLHQATVLEKIAFNVPAEFGKYMWIVGNINGGVLVPRREDYQMFPGFGGCNCFQIVITSADGPSPSLSDTSDNIFYICKHKIQNTMATKTKK
ncbi:MAG: hypothetical protein MUP71_01260 [Candidatus Aminicenantes bacterium]|nr:hypothetical protein [Candidatus Aminicenantes bacterium]